MTKRFISFVLLLSLMLPIGMGLIHAFHEHDNDICYAKTEQHIHQENPDCDQHYFFSQPFNQGLKEEKSIRSANWSLSDDSYSRSLIILNTEETDPDRGPPFFNVN